AVFRLVLSLPAQATTYYHFENFKDLDDAVVTPGSGGNSYEWTFNLNADLMPLWEVEEPLNFCGSDWPTTNLYGHMTSEDILHRAYLIMKFAASSFVVALDGSDTTLTPGPGAPPDVRSYLMADHQLIVEVRLGSSGFDTFEEMNLCGCFEVFDAQGGGDPVPEPGTLTLLGMGVAIVALRLRK
ncbi:MAG: PEP-CTERM sorting domain-containing protein, partial [Desulfuromonadaceae bacterium]